MLFRADETTFFDASRGLVGLWAWVLGFLGFGVLGFLGSGDLEVCRFAGLQDWGLGCESRGTLRERLTQFPRGMGAFWY